MPLKLLTRPSHLHHDPWKKKEIICKKLAPALTDGKTPAVINGIDWGQCWTIITFHSVYEAMQTESHSSMARAGLTSACIPVEWSAIEQTALSLFMDDCVEGLGPIFHNVSLTVCV